MSSAALVPVTGRAVVIKAGQPRAVPGIGLAPGQVLATGVILQVDRDDEAREVRLEMPGADIHYVGYDETVTILATLDDDVLHAISLGTFIARADQRRPRLLPRIQDGVRRGAARVATKTRTATASVRTGRSNPGPVGQYDEDVEHYTDICPVHGETTFARHKAGMRAGRQRYNARCLKCHSAYNLDHPSITTSQEG